MQHVTSVIAHIPVSGPSVMLACKKRHHLYQCESYLQITMPCSIYNGALQLEGVHKWNQRGQTTELDALIDLCNLKF